MRLIDADKIYPDCMTVSGKSAISQYQLANAQTVEARPQGEWLEYNATGKKQYMCSECSMKEKNPKIARYCYWCGAKMKGDVK